MRSSLFFCSGSEKVLPFLGKGGFLGVNILCVDVGNIQHCVDVICFQVYKLLAHRLNDCRAHYRAQP